MAYKNKNKNKRHVRQLRISQGNITVKHYRKKERYYKKHPHNNPHKEMTLEEIEVMMKERGMM